MRKIHGRVLVKETNTPIPNLVVAAFDTEIKFQDIIQQQRTENKLSPNFIQQLGKRIGSVLTNETGDFFLNREDLHFEGVESRPDLILVVFAPEDIQDDVHPFPLPPEKRILYISTVPRDDAGAEEAYIIRLLQMQLDKFQIPSTYTNKENETNSLRLFNAIEQSYVFSDNLKERLKPRIKEQVDKSNQIKKEAGEKFKNFSALSGFLKNHPLFIKDKEQLPEIHKKVIVDGLNRLKKYEGYFQVNLTKEEIKSLGFTIGENGTISGQMKSSSDLWELMQKKNASVGGNDLIRVRNLNDKSLEMLFNKYIIEKK